MLYGCEAVSSLTEPKARDTKERSVCESKEPKARDTSKERSVCESKEPKARDTSKERSVCESKEPINLIIMGDMI